MSISVKSLRCPDCNAAINIDKGRKQCFCSYCGARIVIGSDNEFEYTSRVVDEAAIEQAKTEKEIELAKLKAAADADKRNNMMIIFYFLMLFIICVGCVIAGLLS